MTPSWRQRFNQNSQRPTLYPLRRALLLFYIASLLGIALTTTWNSRVAYHQTLDTFRDNMLSVAHSLDEHTARSFASVEQAMQNIAEDLNRLGGIAHINERTTHQTLKEKIRLTPQIRGIIAIDAQGVLRAHGLEYPTRNFSLADRSYYAYHRNNADLRPLIDIPVVSRTDGQWLIPVTQRINQADGRFGGILLSGVEPVYFLQFYDTLKLPRGVRIQLLRNDGAVLLGYPFDKTLMGANLREKNPARFEDALRRADAGDGGHFLNFDGELRYELFLTNQGKLPITIRISADETVIFSQHHRATLQRVAIAVLLALLISGLVYLLFLQIERMEEVESRLHLTQCTVDEATDMMLWCTPSGQLRYINHSFAQVAGLTETEALHSRITELFLVSAPEWHQYCETLRQNRKLQTESHLKQINQHSIPVELTLSLIRYRDEECISITARDISERREAEYELRRHRDHLQDMVEERTAEIRTVLDASPLAIVLSVAGIMRLTNPAFEALFGFDAAAAQGKSEYLIYGSAGRYAELQPHIRAQIIANRGIYHGEVELQRADQSTFWAMMFIKALDPDDPDRGVISIIEDITTQRIGAQALRQSERLKRAIIDTSADGFLLVDTQGRVADANPAFCKLFDCECDKIIAQPVTDLLDRHSDLLFPQIQSGSHIEEITLPGTDGQMYTFLANCGPIHNDQGQIEYYFVFLTDIGKLKEIEQNLTRAKEAAEAANLSKSVFLANMSHELRTPMHSILSFSEMGIEKLGKTDAANIQRYFERIQSSGNRLLVLLNDLLDMSRLEANKMNYSKARHRLQSTVRAAVGEMGPLLNSKGLQIEIDEHAPQITLNYDRSRLIQVVVNLLSNAIKFSPEGHAIHIDFVQASLGERPAAGFSVRDHGPGVPPEDREAIFDKFIQSKRQDNPGGTGLGLAISRQIMQDHEGTITVENHPDGGAIFTVLLPQDTTPMTSAES